MPESTPSSSSNLAPELAEAMMAKKKISIGFSTCPNDTFIFDALVNGKIDTRGYEFDLTMADVEVLNRKASNGELDVTKLSMFAYAKFYDKYVILDSGSALGYSNGPLIISKRAHSRGNVPALRVAIPGINTTAHFLLSALFPPVNKKTEILFSGIEDAIRRDEVDAGLIIHETRFTYQQHGFVKVADLGELWERQTGHPVPLGCIAANRNLPDGVMRDVNELIRQSLEYALANPAGALAYCKLHAQEMAPEVMRQHIDLYVNEFSLSLGSKGRDAITFMFKEAERLGFVNLGDKGLFFS